MQVVCPNCGEPVSADHINIQRMAAVCPACHTVFQFDPSAPKTKHRKVKQPDPISTDEADGHVNIAFRTNFRLDRNETFLVSGFFSVIFTLVTLLLAVKALANPATALSAVGMGLLTLIFYYGFALVAYNKTHIEVSDDEITVSRKPLPNFLSHANTINLAGIEHIRYEETAASKKEGYDTPRYNVWAEMVDGNRKLVVGDVVEDYAVFISQRLNELLEVDAAPDVSRLLDDNGEADDGQAPEAVITPSKSHLH